MNLGPTELLIILAIVMLIFGSTQLPKLARSIGHAKREFETGQRDGPTPEDIPVVTVTTDSVVAPRRVVETHIIEPQATEDRSR